MEFSLFGFSVTSLHTNTKSRYPNLQAEEVHTTDLMKYSCVLDSLTVTDKIEMELILVGAIDAETNCRRGFLSALTS